MSLKKIPDTKTSRQIHKKPLRPLFPWVGSKRREIKYFEPLFPEYETYSEPFVGAGAVYWYERPEKAVINDYTPDVTNFYKQVKIGNLNKVHNKMEQDRKEKKFSSMTNYKYMRDNYNPKSGTGEAYKFLYLRKTSFGSQVSYDKDGNQRGSFRNEKIVGTTNELKNPEYEKQLKGTKIMTGDFEKAAKAADSPTTFHFFDPPYDSPTNDYTGQGFTREDHKRLAKLFYSLKGKAMITVNDTPFIRSLYKKRNIKRIYGATLATDVSKGKRAKMRTLVICNY